jgi:hypothetical protein
MDKATKTLITIVLLTTSAFALREYIGRDIECSHGVHVTEETEARDQAAQEVTTLQKIFFTQRNCRTLSEQELKESYRTLTNKPK